MIIIALNPKTKYKNQKIVFLLEAQSSVLMYKKGECIDVMCCLPCQTVPGTSGEPTRDLKPPGVDRHSQDRP